MSLTAPNAPPNLPVPPPTGIEPTMPMPPPPRSAGPPHKGPKIQRRPGATGGDWNAAQHPRGRGGMWIVSKGAGYGASGPDQTTKQLQQRLQQLGYHTPSDGKFGPATEAAVKAFQAKYGLDTTGGVDAATVAVLQTPPDQSLAQVQAQRAAATATASATARKTATAAATKKATARTTRVRAAAKTAGQSRSAALKAGTPGVAPGTSTKVTGVGHMGTVMLKQGTGMTGKSDAAVSNLQAALTQAGYKLTKDGRFGPKTEAAVKKLQKDYGLNVDGIVGPATKALLLGLESSAGATKKVKRKAPAKPLPGEVAVLATGQQHVPHGSRSAGSRMRLKPAPPARASHSIAAPGGATIATSATDLPDPDLEEDTSVGGNGVANTTTVAFGVGGEYSRSIKDARPAPEPTPLVDLPVWDRLQKIANPPSYVIPDGRDIDQPTVTRPVSLMIPDGRDVVDQTQVALTEAIAARKAARDGRTFVRALARERLLREKLQEAEAFTEALHPRGRGGKWVDVLGKLKALKTNRPAEIEGVPAMHLSSGHYAAAIPGVSDGLVHHQDPERVADEIVAHSDRQADLRAHGERAVAGLSSEAAQHFTRDWSQRGDPAGAAERSEMYQQVHSEDPKGYVRDVFSTPMNPDSRREAERALAAAEDRDRSNKVAPYFDLSKPHEMVSVDSLRPTKVDPESSYQNARRRMNDAARGEMAKRKPLTAQRGNGNRLLLVDGHATLEAAKRDGITHVPVEIRPRVSSLDPNAKPEDVAAAQRLERSAVDYEAAQRRPAGQPFGRWTAVIDHPEHGATSTTVTAHSRNAARRAAALTGLGSVRSLEPEDEVARGIEGGTPAHAQSGNANDVITALGRAGELAKHEGEVEYHSGPATAGKRMYAPHSARHGYLDAEGVPGERTFLPSLKLAKQAGAKYIKSKLFQDSVRSKK